MKLINIFSKPVTPQIGVTISGKSGTAFLSQVAGEAIARCGALSNPQESVQQFQRDAVSSMLKAELSRHTVEGDQDYALARSLSENLKAAMRFRIKAQFGSEPTLSSVMEQSFEGLPIEFINYKASKKAELHIKHGSNTGLGSSGLRSYVAKLHQEGKATQQIEAAFNRVATRIDDNGGLKGLLAGRKYVVLGGAAEMAPVNFLLQASAEVLFVDLKPYDESRYTDVESFDGTIHFVSANLQTQPGEIVETIKDFARKDKVAATSAGFDDVGILPLAYARSGNREVSLQAAMNAIVDKLPKDMVRSIGYFLSPSTPMPVDEVTVAQAEKALKQDNKPLHGLFAKKMRANMITSPNSTGVGVPRSINARQGASYWAANWIGKSMEAVVKAADGYRVALVVPGIVNTRSMDELSYQLAFSGCSELGIDIFSAETSQLNGVIPYLDIDLAEEAAPSADDVFGNYIHGGVFTAGYALDSMIIRAVARSLLPQKAIPTVWKWFGRKVAASQLGVRFGIGWGYA